MKIRPPSLTLVVLATTVALLVLPIVLDLAKDGKKGPFHYVAADTFYYLSIARNIGRHGIPSFDGRFATNGYHPLWQFVLGGLYFFVEHAGKARSMVLVAVEASLVLVAGAVVFLGLAMEGRDRRLTPAFLLLPVGLYGLLTTSLYTAHLPNLAGQNSFATPRERRHSEKSICSGSLFLADSTE